MHVRKLKIQSKYKSRKIVPELRLNGNWLEQAGFKVGSMVEIVAGTNELIIKAL